MFNGRVLLVLLCVIFLMGCSSARKEGKRIIEQPMTVETEINEDADFGKYHTWAFMPVPPNAEFDPRLDNPEFKGLVRNAVEREMFTRGYRRVETSPDIVINAHAAIERITEEYIEEQYNGSYYPEYRMGMDDSKFDPSRAWDEGSMVFFVFDAKTREMVYRGAVQLEVAPDGGVSKDEQVSRIDEMTRLMMEKLPSRK
jgi:hypothetical protein